jgi:hypothetical protein
MTRRRGFGDFSDALPTVPTVDAGIPTSKFSLLTVKSQKDFLGLITQQMAQDAITPTVVRAAKRITMDCDARDDQCELEAIYNAVKFGDPRVKGLGKGVRYIADNFEVDYSTSPEALLKECEAGACAEDCESMAALCGALALAAGFRVGLCAWGPAGAKDFTHMFAIALIPKEAPDGMTTEYGLDPSADVGDGGPGWQPEQANRLTAMVTAADYVPKGKS